MIVDFSAFDVRNRPMLVLKSASDKTLGILGYAKNLKFSPRFNEVSTLSFSIPAYADGHAVPYYDKIIGMRIIWLKDVGQFVLTKPEEIGDGISQSKSCTAYSLEYEFTFKKITLTNGTYNFWDRRPDGDSLLAMIMQLMPNWRVGRVSESLIGKYRTYEVSNENLYNFIKGTVQNSYGCIFDFDTMTRTVNVIDVEDDAIQAPVYISLENLAKELKITEITDDLVTRLDVSGADGVNIRDVNPTGTNQLINLDYFMTPDNFSAEIIAKYNAWKGKCDQKRDEYFAASLEYTAELTRLVTEQARLADLKGQLAAAESAQSVTISAAAQGILGNNDPTPADRKQAVAAAQAAVSQKQAEIDGINAELEVLNNQIANLVSECSFASAFTEAELLQIDPYLRDDEVTDSSFVAPVVDTYANQPMGSQVSNATFSITDAQVTPVSLDNGKTIYNVKGGNLAFGTLTSAVISAIAETKSSNGVIITAYLNRGTYDGNSFPTASVSLTGTMSGAAITDAANEDGICSELELIVQDGFLYFTFDMTEYQKRSVAYDLYEYGQQVLGRLCQPSFTFSVTAANFLSHDDFVAFKAHFRLGRKLYINEFGRGVLKPICIGADVNWDNVAELSLLFGDSYASSDSTFRMVDLLNQSISMGKSVDTSRFTYSAFTDTGASSGLKEFVESALDVSKNAILSSSDQAISWDGAGLRLRKYANATHQSYDDEQIWMINNSIVMTDDGWSTAKMAIGKFHDDELGDCWGIAAPMLVGKMIAGSELVIESAKKSGGTAVFRMDEDGCRLFNSDFSVYGSNIHIALNPELGIAMGTFPIYSIDQTTGAKTLNEQNAKFWADTDGNLHIAGTLEAATGTFSGSLSAASGTFTGELVAASGSFSGTITAEGGSVIAGWNTTNTAIYRGSDNFSADNALYFGQEGLSLGSAFKAHVNPQTNVLEYLHMGSGITRPNESGTGTVTVYPFEMTLDNSTGTYRLSLNNIDFDDNFRSMVSAIAAATFNINNSIYKTTQLNNGIPLFPNDAEDGSLGILYDGSSSSSSSSIPFSFTALPVNISDIDRRASFRGFYDGYGLGILVNSRVVTSMNEFDSSYSNYIRAGRSHKTENKHIPGLAYKDFSISSNAYAGDKVRITFRYTTWVYTGRDGDMEMQKGSSRNALPIRIYDVNSDQVVGTTTSFTGQSGNQSISYPENTKTYVITLTNDVPSGHVLSVIFFSDVPDTLVHIDASSISLENTVQPSSSEPSTITHGIFIKEDGAWNLMTNGEGGGSGGGSGTGTFEVQSPLTKGTTVGGDPYIGLSYNATLGLFGGSLGIQLGNVSGLEIAEDGMFISLENNGGLKIDSLTNELAIKLKSGGGLAIDSDGLYVANGSNISANAPLTMSNNVLSLSLNDTLSVSQNTLGVKMKANGGIVSDTNGLYLNLKANGGLAIDENGLLYATGSGSGSGSGSGDTNISATAPLLLNNGALSLRIDNSLDVNSDALGVKLKSGGMLYEDTDGLAVAASIYTPPQVTNEADHTGNSFYWGTGVCSFSLDEGTTYTSYDCRFYVLRCGQVNGQVVTSLSLLSYVCAPAGGIAINSYGLLVKLPRYVRTDDGSSITARAMPKMFCAELESSHNTIYYFTGYSRSRDLVGEIYESSSGDLYLSIETTSSSPINLTLRKLTVWYQ